MSIFFQMPGRVPACSTDDVIKVIIDAKEVVLKGECVAVPTENVWTELSLQLGEEMTPKSLYTFVKMNKHIATHGLKI